ncbi:hypothetical protein GCM10028857_20860 [Salinarchaeum chitinilyticum]
MGIADHGLDEPDALPAVTVEEIFEAETIERHPEASIVIVDGEPRYDPYGEFATDQSEE